MSAYADRVVVVTGASEGIGRALCLELARRRARLVVAARNVERLQTLAMRCRDLGAQVLVQPVEVTAADSCRALIEATVAHHGTLDVLVNNAGGTMWTPFDAIEDLSIFDRMMWLNYLGSVYPTFYALPYLKQSRGRLVGVASVAGLTGIPTRTAYAAAKHAAVGFFDSLRIELRGSGVSVTVVCPDFVLSEIHRRALGADGKPLGKSPLDESRIMTAERCAALMAHAIARRRRLLITSLRGRAGRWLGVIAPALVDRIAARAIHRGH